MTISERMVLPRLLHDVSGSVSVRYRAVIFCVAFGSAASILFSIAVSQILLGAGLVLLAIKRPRIEFPPIQLPLALFFAATILADLTSGHPMAGVPQIRKLYVFGIVLLVSFAFRSSIQIRNVLFTWSGISLLSALDGFVHVFARWREAVRLKCDTYDYFVDDRITGFASHWMTFGGEQMIVLLMLLAYLLFACPRQWRLMGWACAALIWTSLMLGLTRSVFLLGVPLGIIYLLWAFQPRALAVIPLLGLVSYLTMPFQVRERVWSVVSPQGSMDSNRQRYIMRRTGWEMVKAHPWLGLGPEEIKPQFDAFVPADIPRPLPRGWYGHLHNVYLQYAAERGVPALFFLLWIIGKVMLDFLRALRRRTTPDDERYILHGAIAVTIAILAEGLFEYNLGDSEVLTMFLIVISSACNVMRNGRCPDPVPCNVGWDDRHTTVVNS